MPDWRDVVRQSLEADALAVGDKLLPVTGLITATRNGVVVRIGPAAQGLCAKVSHQSGLIRQEASVLSRLSTPRVTPLVEAHVDARPPYLVMKELEPDLIMASRGQDGHGLAVATWLRDVAVCLRDVHHEGFLHLDVKPDNVLLEDGQRRLIDFGLARRADEGFETDHVTGTDAFCSPAHWRGRGSARHRITSASPHRRTTCWPAMAPSPGTAPATGTC